MLPSGFVPYLPIYNYWSVYTCTIIYSLYIYIYVLKFYMMLIKLVLEQIYTGVKQNNNNNNQ